MQAHETVREAPGPKAKPVVGHLPERRKRPLRLFLDGALKYGGVVRYQMGPIKAYLITDLDGIKHVLQDNAKNYRKGFGYDRLEPVLGKGLLTSEGEYWRRQRKLAAPAFHMQRLAALADTMTRATQELADEWTKRMDGKPMTLELTTEMMRLTLTVVGRTLLGADMGADAAKVYEALTFLLEEVNVRVLSLTHWFERVPLPRNIKFKKHAATLDRIVFRIIEERRRNPADRGDLLSMFMMARDEETGEGMTDRQIRDEVMTMFLAGHETTATALTWTYSLLSRHPEIDRRFRAELESVLAGRPPRFDDLSRLTYSRMIFDETLRLYPPAWTLSRQANAEDRICGYRIPKDAVVLVSPYVVQHLPAYWPNPEGFDPERFAPDQPVKRHKFAYFPFGGGARVCIGSAFAQMESLIILAVLSQRFRFELLPGRTVEPEPLITLRPRGGLWVRVLPK